MPLGKYSKVLDLVVGMGTTELALLLPLTEQCAGRWLGIGSTMDHQQVPLLAKKERPFKNCVVAATGREG